MQQEQLGSGPLRIKDPRREAMLEPEDVSAMLRLNELGWGAKRIARELGVSRNTVRRYRGRARSRLASLRQSSSSCRRGVDSGCRLTNKVSRCRVVC